MEKLKKIIGIVSWFPDDVGPRMIRIRAFNKLLRQLNQYFPDIPLVIVAQNWKTDVPNILNEAKIYKYTERLGILKARKILREKFLTETDADYILMFDDDCVISCSNDVGIEEYLSKIDKNPNGFAFLKGDSDDAKRGSLNPYKDSCLNLCAISRKILEETDFPNIDPEQSVGFEDRIFSMLLYVKYKDFEFDIPNSLTTTHFHDPNIPSTWSRRKQYRWDLLRQNTINLEKFIFEHGDLPQRAEHE